MKIQALRVGPLATNCYLLGDEESGLCAVIDPGAQCQKKILPALEQFGMKCAMILLTHGHYDHIMALKDLKDAVGAPIYIHEKDAHMLTEDYLKGWKAAAAQGYRQALADNLLKDGDKIQLGKLEITVMNTPGHTPGSCVYLCQDAMFAGDTLFRGGCGRWDLDGGSMEQMMESLVRLSALPGDWRVLPGHDAATTLETERQTNSYMIQAVSHADRY